MKRKRLSILLGSTLVVGVLLGAAVASMILSSSHTFDLTVTDQYQMAWSPPDAFTTWDECKPSGDIYKDTWYNDTIIQANLTNYDNSNGYDLTINISFYCEGIDVYQYMVRGAAIYKIEGNPWVPNSNFLGTAPNLAFSFAGPGANNPNRIVYTLLTGISLGDVEGNNWVHLKIRFWLHPNAPTGSWHIELNVEGTQIT